MDINRFKTPIRLVSSIASMLLFVHIIGTYIYVGGEQIGEVGGSISIGIVGESPGELLNPLEYGQNTYKDMIFRFMFRSPIRGLPNGRGYVGDIANCDLSNLASITCKIQENALWSDGSKMSSQDVLATYEALKNQSVNPKISELIKSFDISGTGQEFTLKSRAGANPLTLDLLTYPIVRSDMVELIKSKRINKTNFISSGPYTYIDSGVDPVFGFDRVTLERSKENGKNVWIEKYIFKFFDDRTQLEKNIDTLHIILPTKDQSSKSIESPRFAEMLYSTYEYIGLFFQSERVVSDLRQSLALSLSNSLSGNIEPGDMAISNIFFSDVLMVPSQPRVSLPSTMRDLGFIKRDEILSRIAEMPIILTGGSIEYEKNTFFQYPSTRKVYFANGDEENIVISGNVPSNVQKIEINGYELQEYSPGNNRFVYRVSPKNQNLLDGKNQYILTLIYADGRASETETLTVYYIKDPLARKNIEQDINQTYLAKLNSPEEVAKRQLSVQKEKEKAEQLDPRYYYDANYKPFEMKLFVMNEPRQNEVYAEKIKANLMSLGIKTNIEVVNQKMLSEQFDKGEKNYDMILIGFETSPKRTQLSQLFDSNRAAKGVNFSKIKNKPLDDLFLKYKLAVDTAAYDTLEQNMLSIFQKESVLLPIASPLTHIDIDRNLKGIQNFPVFGDIRNLDVMLAQARIKEVFLIKLEGKSFRNFFEWIMNPTQYE